MTSDVLVLCYHALSPTWTATLSTTPARFESQITLLVRRGYSGVTFTDAVTQRQPGKVVAVTFDDAYRSVIELARPILARFGLPATVFAPTNFMGSGQPMQWSGIDRWLAGPDEQELTPMSWEELRTLCDAGWEIGSHTTSHPHLTDVDDAALQRELEHSKAACESHLDRPCTSLAYPYGDLDARVVAAARRAGYRACAALAVGRVGARDPMTWPRIGIYRLDDDRRFRLKISPVVRHLRRAAPSRAAQVLLRVSGRLR